MRKLTPAHAALILLIVAFATIAGAWIFEFFGYAPCDLCLKQRWAYYIGVPLVGLTFLAALRGMEAARAGLWLAAAIFLGSAVFAAYHAGVEWGFWPGPTGCTGSSASVGSMDDFMKQLQNVQIVRCDEVALRILGLSLAGWNAAISAAMSVLAVIGARAKV